MFEVGYAGILADKVYLTLDYYYAWNDQFITDLIPQLDARGNRTNPDFGAYQPPSNHPAPQALVGALRANLPPPLFAILSNNFDGVPVFVARSYANFGEVNTQGIDFGLNYYFLPDWTFSFTYSWFDFKIQDPTSPIANQLLPNTPENKFVDGSLLCRLEVGLGVRREVGGRLPLGGRPVPRRRRVLHHRRHSRELLFHGPLRHRCQRRESLRQRALGKLRRRSPSAAARWRTSS